MHLVHRKLPLTVFIRIVVPSQIEAIFWLGKHTISLECSKFTFSTHQNAENLTQDTLTNNLHVINCCSNIVICLLPNTKLLNVSVNISILIFPNMAPTENLVFARGAPNRINMVHAHKHTV